MALVRSSTPLAADDAVPVARLSARVDRRLARTTSRQWALRYAAFVVAWNLVRLTPVGRWAPFELLDIFGVWLYLPLPFLVLAAATRRAWVALAALCVVAVTFVVEYGLPLGLAPPPPAGGVAVRVLTSNVLYRNDDHEGLAAALAAEQPDIVALQELNPRLSTGLEEALGDAYPYRALYPNSDKYGLGLLSRYPIVEAPPPATAVGQCQCLVARLMVDGRPVTVVVAHPLPNPIRLLQLPRISIPIRFDTAAQRPALEALRTTIEQADRPLLALGDFNVADRQPFYRELARTLHDTHREVGAGFGLTFPNASGSLTKLPPLVRIDYVWHDDAWQAQDTWTGALQRSDHRYVVADLTLKP